MRSSIYIAINLII